MKYLLLIGPFIWALGLCSCSNGRRYENLHNPTAYTFTAPSSKIIAILKERHGPESWGPIGAGFYEGVYGLGIDDYYTRHYWTGRQEERGEVDPPEAGRIGTITATFAVQIVAKSENRTLVSVTVETFRQQVGRRYTMFPHFHKRPVYADVKSDTYFEYLFLHQLGELLGEKNMPVIHGSPER
jgi:hypothetical protein